MISQNYTYTQFDNQLKMIKRLLCLFPNDEMLDKLIELEHQLNTQRNLPDDFNKFYASKGWCAYESMNMSLMSETTELARRGNIEKGENLLVEFYSKPNNIKYLLYPLRHKSGFTKRFEILENAYEDFKQERYYACIPVFLMIIDGVIDEVTKSNTGFFSSNFNANLWNSIVGHRSGLSTLAKTYAATRKKINTEPIFIPYRNGILHGKDINYGNEKVATKCLATIFAVSDWVTQYESNEHIEPKKKPTPSLTEALKEISASIHNWIEHEKMMKKTKSDIEAWKPRNFSAVKVGTLAVQDNTPEAKAKEFMNAVISGNYNKIEGSIAKHDDKKSKGKRIHELKTQLSNLKFSGNPEIVSIRDCSPAISEVDLKVSVTFDDKRSSQITVTIRMIYQTNQIGYNAIVAGNPNGKWYVVEVSLINLSKSYWEAYFNSI